MDDKEINPGILLGQIFAWVGTLCLLVGVVVLAWWLGHAPPSESMGTQEPMRGVLLPEPRPLGPFQLIDHHQQPFGPAQLKGKWTLAFFGYTSCPDICPVSLGILSEIFGLLDANQASEHDDQGIFVSVDPKRDHPQLLKEYVTYFHPDFIAVSGEEAAIKGFSEKVGAHYVIMPDEKSSGDKSENYVVAHSGSLFLIDPDVRLAAVFPAPHDATRIVQRLQQIRENHHKK